MYSLPWVRILSHLLSFLVWLFDHPRSSDHTIVQLLQQKILGRRNFQSLMDCFLIWTSVTKWMVISRGLVVASRLALNSLKLWRSLSQTRGNPIPPPRNSRLGEQIITTCASPPSSAQNSKVRFSVLTVLSNQPFIISQKDYTIKGKCYTAFCSWENELANKLGVYSPAFSRRVTVLQSFIYRLRKFPHLGNCPGEIPVDWWSYLVG